MTNMSTLDILAYKQCFHANNVPLGVGEEAVGKSCLVERFVYGRFDFGHRISLQGKCSSRHTHSHTTCGKHTHMWE